MATMVDPSRSGFDMHRNNAGLSTSNHGSLTADETPPSSPSSTMLQHQQGRMKAPPVCNDVVLKKTAMTTKALSELTFLPPETQQQQQQSLITSAPTDTEKVIAHPHPLSSASSTGLPDVVALSSSSSTCTRESETTLSDVEGHPHHSNIVMMSNSIRPGSSMTTPASPSQLKFDRSSCGMMNARVSLMKTSRQGRSTQRWVTDPNTNESIRLVTGCVPILKGGKILFVSASRKAEWILPKGGWEQDEEMEESAIRECFEEAGVLGTLGPRLKEIQYETRKSKKRRLQQEELLRKKLYIGSALGGEASETEKDEDDLDKSSSCKHATAASAGGPVAAASPISLEDMKRIRGLAAGKQTQQQQQLKQCSSSNALNYKSSDETISSVASSVVSGTYSQVRMTLFPLYVSEVHEHWPESGRMRKAVEIDEAIKMMETRPEFKAALEEVKAKGYHLAEPTQQTTSA